MWKWWQWSRDLGWVVGAVFVLIIILCQLASCPRPAAGAAQEKLLDENHAVYRDFAVRFTFSIQYTCAQKLDNVVMVEEIKGTACSVASQDSRANCFRNLFLRVVVVGDERPMYRR